MSGRYSRKERGSALLIVFVFAAIVAISLYMEMPVAAFEAQRQKERLLISRGNQYARAVKLYVRKTGHYPASIKDLESTNNMRFLRHQYKDPFTGKNDWRLLHAGPNGTIIDSKVAKNGILLPGQNGQTGQSGQQTATSTASFGGSNSAGGGSSFGSNTASGGNSGAFGNSSFGNNSNGAFGNNSFAGSSPTSNSADNSPPEVMVEGARQRPPAVSANGSSGAGSTADASTDAAMALPPSTGAGNGQAAGQSGVPVPGSAAAPDAQAAGQAATQAAGQNAGLGQNGAPTDLKTSMLGAMSGQSNSSSFGNSSNSQMGNMQSGGVAGVASKAGGHSIKLVHDQSDYAKWEFYYDPTKDTVPGGTQMGAYNSQQNNTSQSAFGSQNGTNGQQQSSFGATSTSGSSFGQSGSSNGSSSSFGSSGGFGQGSFGSSSGSSFGSSSSTNNSTQNNAGQSSNSSSSSTTNSTSTSTNSSPQ